MYQHQATLFVEFLWLQMGRQHFSSFISPLNPEVRRQDLGQRARSFGRWWRHELRVRIQMMLSFLSLRSCISVNELKQKLLGDRVCDAVAHSCGQRETCLTGGLIKAVDSPQGDAKHHFTDLSGMLLIKLFYSLSHPPKEFFQ